MQIPIMLGTVKFLHELFTTIWIGGLILMTFVFLPVVRMKLGLGPETKSLVDSIRSRLSKLVYISMIGLLVTGMLLSNQSPLFGGYFSSGNEYSLLLTIKHILIGIMVILNVLRSQAIPRANGIEPDKEQKLNALILILNTIIGVVVLFISGYLSALNIIAQSAP
jgi:putative copper export protein